jgi:hypothetical protein
MEALSGVFEAHHGALANPVSAMETHLWAIDGLLSRKKTHSAAMEAHSWALEASQEAMKAPR